MYLSPRETRLLSKTFGLLAEGLSAADVREQLGYCLMEILQADFFASYVWDDSANKFTEGVSINMNPSVLGTYEAYYQFHDPITFHLQQRRVPSLVTQVMPQRELMQTEFFNDFLARDGLHWGVNVYSYSQGRNIGDLRIWRRQGRSNFDHHTLELLNLIEPAFTKALLQRSNPSLSTNEDSLSSSLLSSRERAVAQLIGEGLTDKEISRRLAIEISSVRTYLKRIFEKLGVSRRSGIAAALRNK
jgi:DNA-binding CsgD family transcriptional regulator